MTRLASWVLSVLLRALRSRRAEEAGYAAIMVAIVVPTVAIGCAAVAVDVGSWYVEAERVQKAADAAALGGVPFLPQDLASAKTRALEVAKRNGFDNVATVHTTNGVRYNPNTVTVELGEKATQLKVTISSTVTNTFGTIIGVNNQTLTRSGTADFQGPAPMGSPCNTFGNEPDAGGGGSSATPVGTARGTTPLPNCSRTPQFWATVEGPATEKLQGDRYQTKACGATSGVDGCTGSVNDDYDDFGYVFVVRVTQAMVDSGSAVELQLYDPMFVDHGVNCGNLPDTSTYANNTTNLNPYVKNNDARNRYADNGPTSASYCTGDYFPGGGTAAMTTSFVLRSQTDTQNAKIAPVQNDISGNACIQQYGALDPTASTFPSVVTASSGSYNAQVAATFHNWVKFCSFKPPRAGDYYLQVRTNVAMGGSGSGYVRTGNAAAAAATGNTTAGSGDNSFAIRAVTASGREKDVAVSGYNHMPIFVNYTAAQAQFNLIRVLPGAAGQKISFSYFDAGDANSAGSVQVQPPPAVLADGTADAKGSVNTTPFPGGGCTAYGGSAAGTQVSQTTLTNCTAPFVKNGTTGNSKNNGKTETITIPIPSDYDCNYASAAGCWYRVTLNYGNTSTSTVNDITTWDATIVGDPVRLIE